MSDFCCGRLSCRPRSFDLQKSAAHNCAPRGGGAIWLEMEGDVHCTGATGVELINPIVMTDTCVGA